ncbi:MAG: sialate O-acetylesterase [Bacilli bacterium]|nr:sialate O-acetylesterase [Bacilli bacterium]
MKIIRLLSLPIVLMTLNGCNKSPTIKIILLAGQSNMEGHDSPWGNLTDETINEYRLGHDNVKINYNCTYEKNYEGGVANTSNGEFVDVDFGQGRNKKLFGPEIGVAAYLGKHDSNQQYYLIKSCEGSSSLAVQWAEDGSCYQTFVEDVNASINFFKEKNLNFQITAFMWMQGEHDADPEDRANHYKERMLGLIDRINSTFKDYVPSYGISLIDAGITTDGMWKYYEKINQAKKEIVASNDKYRYVADSETLPKIDPGYHYSPESYLKLGERFAEEYLSIK